MTLSDFFYEEVIPGVSRVCGFFPQEFSALQTDRAAGVSAAPFDAFNLARHVGDEPESVAANRARLAQVLPGEPAWLEQVHGCDAVVIGSPQPRGPSDSVRADASLTAEPGQVCAIMTADCLPVLVARPATGQCAAVHAGWRGLAAGVIEKTLQQMLEQQGVNAAGGAPLLAQAADPWFIWLGPAIGQTAFEVGPEVHETFVQQNPGSAAAFKQSPRREGHFLASLQQLAMLRIQGFEQSHPGLAIRVAADPRCVFDHRQQFFSFRREPRTGRMASLIFRRMTHEAST